MIWEGGFLVRTAWRVIALIFAAATVIIAATALIGLTPQLAQQLPTVLGLGAFCGISASACWLAGEYRLRGRFLHVPVLIGLMLISTGLSAAGGAAPALMLLYLAPLIFVALFMSIRMACGYVLLVAIAMAWVVAASDEPLAPLQTVVTGGGMLAVASVTSAARWQISRAGRYALELSGRDALTGLANLRQLYERLETEISRAARMDTTLILFMVDLDDFKSVNDLYSHTTGDQTLTTVAKAIQQIARKDELVARRGGDEFALVTTVRTTSDAQRLAARIQGTIRRARREICREIVATASVGFSVHRPGESVSELLARADLELHSAKAKSRRGESLFRVTRNTKNAALDPK